MRTFTPSIGKAGPALDTELYRPRCVVAVDGGLGGRCLHTVAVRVGVALPQYEVDRDPAGPALWPVLLAAARRAERLGLDSVWLSDHPFAVAPDGSESGALEPLVALSALARSTERVRIGTLVLAATMRRPALLAHTAKTLPPQRTVLGIGTGWYEPEHRAFGMALGSYADRAAALEASAAALHGLPSPRPRVLAGGSGRPVLEIAARYADAWNVSWDVTPETFTSLTSRLDDACERINRDPATLERSVGLTVLVAGNDRDREAAVERLRSRAPFLAGLDAGSLSKAIVTGTAQHCVERIASYGADEVVVAPLLRDDLEMIERLATEVAPALRS